MKSLLDQLENAEEKAGMPVLCHHRMRRSWRNGAIGAAPSDQATGVTGCPGTHRLLSPGGFWFVLFFYLLIVLAGLAHGSKLISLKTRTVLRPAALAPGAW